MNQWAGLQGQKRRFTMIWVIGDIHGMFDPLKRIMSSIHANSRRKDSDTEIEKIIFLGDYIDYGPSSKEVVDYIMDLPFKTVCLMGNHDDLMLQFLERSDLFKSFGNVWFRGNGGQRTVSSFFPKVFYSDSNEEMPREEFPLGDKYLQFFKNLIVSHEEQIGDWKFAFVHAMLSTAFSVQEQLLLKSYDDFHRWRKEKKLWIEDTILWDRSEPKKKFDDYILVHGHTPTTKLDKIWEHLNGYDAHSGTPFFKFEEAKGEPIEFKKESYKASYTAPIERLISINVDTGAVYGNRLTAIGLSEELLSENKFLVCQVLVDKGYRLAEEYQSYYVHLE